MTLVAALAAGAAPAARAGQRARVAQKRVLDRRRRPLGPGARARAGARRRRRASSASSTTTRRCGGAGSTASPSSARLDDVDRAARRPPGRRGAGDDPGGRVGAARAARRVLHGRRRRLPLRRPRDRAAALSDAACPPSELRSQRPNRSGSSPGAARWLLGHRVPRASRRCTPGRRRSASRRRSSRTRSSSRRSRAGSPRPGRRRGSASRAASARSTPTSSPRPGGSTRPIAWEAAKLIGALVMTAAIFPAYGLARFVVSRPLGDRGRDRRGRGAAARLRAVPARGAARLPVLDDGALGDHRRDRPADVAAGSRSRAALCLVAPFVRGELAVLLAVFGAGLFVLLWRTERLPAVALDAGAPATGSGAAVLVVGVAIVFSAAAGHRSDAWYVATGFEKHRMLDHGLWSVGGDDDRPRRAAGGRDGRRLRLRGASAPPPRAARSSSSASRRVVGVRRLRRGQGRLPLDRVLAR